MAERTHIRRCLIQPGEAAAPYTERPPRSPSASPRHSNMSESDREWIALQRRTEATGMAAEAIDREIQGIIDENDEAFMNAEQLRGVIQRKEEANELKRTEVLAEQDKLLWDLTFAYKRCLVEEAGPTTLKGIGLSQVSVPSILSMAENEDPQPSEWATWIQNKYRQE